MIRVLELIDEATLGGGQMHVLMLARYLDKSEFSVTVATEPQGFLVDEATKLGVPVIPVSITNTLRMQSLRKMNRLLRQEKFDIIHTHGGTAGFWGRLGALVAGTSSALVHTYHGFHYLHEQQRTSRVFRLVDRLLLRFTDRVVCVCESDYTRGLADRLVIREKGAVIRNGIDVERFVGSSFREVVRTRLGVAANDPVFGNVGRLHVQKGHSYLLRAFQRVNEVIPRAWLWIVGDGELRRELVQLAESLGIASRVLFLGARSDIPELLSAIDIFVLSSLWEGQPLSVMEAMASGKPVIVSRVDGVVELIEDGVTGIMVAPGDSVGLATAMSTLASNSLMMENLSRNARRKAEQEFRAQRLAEQTAALYRSCMR